MAKTCLWLYGPAMWQLFFLINLLHYQYANMPVMQAVFMCQICLCATCLNSFCCSQTFMHFVFPMLHHIISTWQSESVLVSWHLNKHLEEQMLLPTFRTVESVFKCWFVCGIAIFSSAGLHWVVILFRYAFMNTMCIYSIHMYIYFHQNKSLVSIKQKEMIHWKWLILRSTVSENSQQAFGTGADWDAPVSVSYSREASSWDWINPGSQNVKRL